MCADMVSAKDAANRCLRSRSAKSVHNAVDKLAVMPDTHASERDAMQQHQQQRPNRATTAPVLSERTGAPMDAYEWIRRAAAGQPLPDDPIGDTAVEIMDRITQNLAMEVPTHDSQHHDDIEEILRRLIINFSNKHGFMNTNERGITKNILWRDWRPC